MDIYNRTRRLVGTQGLEALAGARVIIFGVGGVGSWCAEGLVRYGVTHITLVDPDRVIASNVNRQGMATSRTVGRVKVEALKEKLLEINPLAEITAVREIYSESTAQLFDFDSYDYIVDAIDSLKDKAYLILHAAESSATLFSAMGAALKIDPMRIQVAEFWDVRGCPLAAAIRKKFKQNKTLPAKKFLCVYDSEVLENLGDAVPDEDAPQDSPEELAAHDWTRTKALVNGTLAHVTAIFGFTLAGLVIKDVIKTAL